MKIITQQELLVRLPDLKLIDVRLADGFAGGHLPGANNNCVFEVAFLDRMSELIPDRNEPICVYGFDETSHESRMAADKLHRAGYTNVHDFRGGFTTWQQAGNATESAGSTPDISVEPLIGTRPVDTAESLIEWTGRNLGNKHWGTLTLKAGTVQFAAGKPTGGSLTIDMNSITDLNLEESPLRKILEDHLKSDDFFDVERFPEAVVELSDIAEIADASVGTPNLRIKGAMTMKGVTDEIEFLASAHCNADGQWIAQANFDFDRTKWNVIYGSGRFFRNLGMHVVNDLISLQLKIVA
jgi:rhodanese-related sulfurtransferase/polyisoprenoid-binding protein YceI